MLLPMWFRGFLCCLWPNLVHTVIFAVLDGGRFGEILRDACQGHYELVLSDDSIQQLVTPVESTPDFSALLCCLNRHFQQFVSADLLEEKRLRLRNLIVLKLYSVKFCKFV